MRESAAFELESNLPLTVQIHELNCQVLELAQTHGTGVVGIMANEQLGECAITALEQKIAFDMDQEELLGLYGASILWSLEGANRQLGLVRRSVNHKEKAPEWMDVVTLSLERATSHLWEISADLDNKTGALGTCKRITEKNAALMATALSATIFEDVAGSHPRKKQTLPALIKHATTVYTGLVEVGVSEVASATNTTVSHSISELERAKLDALTPEENRRFFAFVKILEPLSTKVVRDYDTIIRLHDIGDTVSTATTLTAETIVTFLKTLDDEAVERLLQESELLQLAINSLAMEIGTLTQRRFSHVAKDALAIANQGKHTYRETAVAVEDERTANKNAPFSSFTHSKKGLVFRMYLPEIRKIAIMRGGSFYDIEKTHRLAAELLDALYENSEEDYVVFPSFNDFFIALETSLEVGVQPSTFEAITELAASDKDSILARLEESYQYRQEDQDKNPANCYGVDSEIFFPGQGENLKPSRQVCGSCASGQQEKCFDLGIREKHGIWAGTTERGRKVLRKQMKLPEEPETFDDNKTAIDEDPSAEELEALESDLSKVEYDGNAVDDFELVEDLLSAYN